MGPALLFGPALSLGGVRSFYLARPHSALVWPAPLVGPALLIKPALSFGGDRLFRQAVLGGSGAWFHPMRHKIQLRTIPAIPHAVEMG